MDYEVLYMELQQLEKELKESVNAVTRLNKRIAKETETGNLADLKKDLEQMLQTADVLKQRAALLDEAVSAFDTKEYFTSGDFARQLLETCRNRGIDVTGEKGVYEMFPYKVRIYGDEEHPEEIYINRKKVPSFRPAEVAEIIRKGQEKLYKVRFRENQFMNELAEAYDTACLKAGSRAGSNISLTKIYKTMVPMSRSRKEYDSQAFAFDLARLYELGTDYWVSKDGRQFTFGTGRDGKSGIRVLSRTGVESFVTTLRPLATEEE